MRHLDGTNPLPSREQYVPRTECLTPQELAAFSLGDLPDPFLDGIAEHLEHCPQCDAAARQLDGLSDGVIAALRQSSSADVTLRRAHTPASLPALEPALPPVVPGY